MAAISRFLLACLLFDESYPGCSFCKKEKSGSKSDVAAKQMRKGWGEKVLHVKLISSAASAPEIAPDSLHPHLF
jgi:hypothetical protein